jgi:SAM-dependent methyltransferase
VQLKTAALLSLGFGDSMSTGKMRETWQQESHADWFDVWSNLGVKHLGQMYEMFNEIELLLENKGDIAGNEFAEIGCATGELYRYLHNYHPEYSYSGYDISVAALDRAKAKYPEGTFKRVAPDLANVDPKPAISFCRDVVIHQVDPFGFLKSLVGLASEATLLRLRTRDKGSTELDPDVSCQFVYGQWVPYMILNVDEMISAIRDVLPNCGISIVKNYMILGGQVNRFLPKACYYEETGTAETAVCIMNNENARLYDSVQMRHQTESQPAFKSSLLYRAPRYLRRKLLGNHT